MMDDNSIMPFGKYKGDKLANVPASYLLWLYASADLKEGDLRDYIKDNLDQLRQEQGNGK